MFKYTRAVYYYETDKMGVVHHSNYVRWLEEARTFYFNDAGVPYAETEALGVAIPVTDIKLKYMSAARYGDTFTIRPRMTKYTAVRFEVDYTVTNQHGQILLRGTTSHAFVDTKNFKPVALSRAIPERHELMKQLVTTTNS